MLTAFPSLTPRDAHSLFYRPQSTFGSDVPTEIDDNAAGQQGPNGLMQNRGQGREPGMNRRANASSIPTVLMQLNMDEESIRLRKKNIQLFGATWIRPPGLARTLQQEMDERAEHEEHMQMEETVEEGMTTVEVDGNPIANNNINNNINNATPIVPPEEDEVGEDETGEIDEGETLDLEEEDLDAEIPEGSETWSNDDDDDDEEEEEEEEEDDDEEEGEEEEEDGDEAAADVSAYTNEAEGGEDEDGRAPGGLPNDSFNAEYETRENPSTPSGAYTSPSQQLQRHFHQHSMRQYGSSPFSFADVTTQSSEADLEEDDEMELDQGH